MTSEDRYRHEVRRQYEGAGITVHWEPRLCIHSANCIRRLPQVFDVNARPWVDVAMAEADDIAEAIRLCPSGALWYERTDGSPQEEPDQPATMEPQPGGPIYARGDLELQDEDGNIVRRATRLALCRCGASNNKPYCDNSHLAIGFKG